MPSRRRPVAVGTPPPGSRRCSSPTGTFGCRARTTCRFRYHNGVRTFWVHRNDKPFNTATHTNPRSEVRL
ncbi:unnamed protein product [Triticum turgidum subsp. durum]|uniref:Uncharacterized protein n=1 Tax=Triticum turgidum subsp. durum TaxID=4567 RepID=A0A9R1PDQ7_TRITD|nr:unnamed protein product [Triticum turgidum subsp. durum]